MKKVLGIFFLAFFAIVTNPSQGQVHKGMSSSALRTRQTLIMNTLGKYPEFFRPWRTQSEKKVQLRNVVCASGRVNLHFNDAIIQIPIREELCTAWTDSVRRILGPEYRDAKVGFLHNNIHIERYIPNVYRTKVAQDAARKTTPAVHTPLVTRVGQPMTPKGLQGRHLALWPSHGYYYDQKDTTWQFQRPFLFGTVEDLHTFFYTDRYLIPMLESAGAVVITPRERDTSPWEIIVDNDHATQGAAMTTSQQWRRAEGGFAKVEKITETLNPFISGSYMITGDAGGTATYSFTVPEPKLYAVYVSYKPLPGNSPQAQYTVTHSEGSTTFKVNQRIGGGWVYLGHFPFTNKGFVTLSGDGQMTADAVKIGGGMGNVERYGEISGVPRWAEAARYFMQYSGVPHTIYQQEHQTATESDYMDDYKSRGDWVNYLIDNQQIPIDASIALHSNSGIVDTTFGTLMINYSDGGRNMAGRDMADIIQTQIVQDLRATIRPDWTRRSLYDKSYAEVSRPKAPAVIVEMFSHQNFNDMTLALSPAFRFTMTRAIYKGVVKFLASRYSIPYAVQPLPIATFGLTTSSGSATLTWTPPIDPLEPTATPNCYYADGAKLTSTQLQIPLADTLLRIKVRASSDGGLSYAPASSWDLLLAPKNRVIKTLIIRDLDPQLSFDTLTSSYPSRRGLIITPDRAPENDFSISGAQTDFSPLSVFIDNRQPGWGASSNNLLFNGLRDWTETEIETLTADPKITSTGYAILSTNGLTSTTQSFATVIVITNRKPEMIEQKYRPLIGKSKLTIITPPQQFAPIE